jgi:hypothetical protein
MRPDQTIFKRAVTFVFKIQTIRLLMVEVIEYGWAMRQA